MRKLVLLAVVLALAGPVRAFDRNKIKGCLRPGGFECAGKVIDEAISDAQRDVQEKVKKAERERDNAQKELNELKKKGQAALAPPGVPPEYVQAVACLKKEAQGKSSLLGVNLDQAMLHPDQALRGFLARNAELTRKMLAEARNAIPRPKSLTLSIDERGGSASFQFSAGHFDADGYAKSLVAGVHALARVDPTVKCIEPLVDKQADVLRRELPKAMAQVDKVIEGALEPMAAEMVGIALQLVLDKLGTLVLQDKDLVHEMQAVVAESLLAADKIDASARAVAALAGSPTRAQADAVQKTLGTQWTMKPELLIRLAMPAIKAGVKLFADRLIYEASFIAYDVGAYALGKSVLPAGKFAATEICAAGDVFLEWACSGAGEAVQGAWDTAVLAARKPVTKVATIVGQLLVDLAIDQAAAQIEKKAVAQVKQSSLSGFPQAVLARVDNKGRVNKAILDMMMAFTDGYVKRVAAAMGRYDQSVVALANACAK